MASYGEPKQDTAQAVATQFLALARDAEKQYAEGYRAGRIAALREVGCEYRWPSGASCLVIITNKYYWCTVCRLLAESEQGEVGGDR